MKILVIDDEIEICNIFTKAFKGIRVFTASTGSSGIKMLKEKKPQVVFLDLQLPDIHGIEVLKQIKQLSRETAVIVLTGYGSSDNVVEAMRLGAYEFINKPFALEEIRSLLNRVKQKLSVTKENGEEETSIPYDSGPIVGKSQEMLEVYKTIGRIADTDVTILVSGETGTGKELAASVIHSRSSRKNFPFVPVDCVTLPRNLFESELFGYEKGAFTGADSPHSGLIETASGGTLFLDEIGNLDTEMQAKLLRVIQEKTFSPVGSTRIIEANVRIIAATNQNPENAIENGSLRRDFYYRLNVVPIYLPTLRERKEDILLLARHFLKMYSEKPKFLSEEVEAVIQNYPWFGNVRELQNIIRRLVVTSPDSVVTPKDLPKGFLEKSDKTVLNFNEEVDRFRKNIIVEALNKNNWKQQKTAKHLGMSIRSLRHYAKKLNLKNKGNEKP